MAKFVNFVLLLLFVGLVARMIVNSRELASVEKEHRRLVAMHGELEIKDTSKYLVTSVDTGDPMDFQWRTYYPAGLELEEYHEFAGTTRGPNVFQTYGIESIVRCRFDFRDDGVLRAHYLRRRGSGLELLSNRKFKEFLWDHWSELEITRLGEAGPVEIAIDRPLELLTIRVPQKLVGELYQLMGKYEAITYSTEPVFQIIHGTPEAFIWLEEQKEKAKGDQ